jgi:hypothetical protein
MINENERQITKEQLFEKAFSILYGKYFGAGKSYNILKCIAKNDIALKKQFEINSVEELNKFDLPYETNKEFFDKILDVLNVSYNEVRQKIVIACEILCQENISTTSAFPINAIQRSDIMVERIMNCDYAVLKTLHENPDKNEAKQRLMKILGIDNEALNALYDFSYALWCDAYDWKEKGDIWKEKAKSIKNVVC